MPFAVGVSQHANCREAIQECVSAVQRDLAGRTPDVTFVFVSHHHEDDFPILAARIQEPLNSKVLLGCTGEAVIANQREHENGPALCLWSAVLPQTEIIPWKVEFRETPDGVVCDGMPVELGEHLAETRAVFALGEPFSSMPPALIDLFDGELHGVPVIGGMASGGGPGQNKLFFGDQCVDQGAIGVILRGGPAVRTIVSQGCKPIGSPFVVTRSERNIVYSLGGVPPLRKLEELFSTLSERDQELAELGLFLGIAMNEYQESFERGDFLIANVLGADQKSGAVAIGNVVRTGQTVQFHLRDGATADEDLVQLLERETSSQGKSPAAALLFSCNGRGTRMFSEPNHDAGVVQRLMGPVPLAGIFAQGELGPVSGRNYIHGFTASLALFDET
jgi:small ligand-binding sensory domain FIST